MARLSWSAFFFSAVKKGESNMTKAKVYMTDFRVPVGLSLPEKLKRLCRRAGLEKEIDFEGNLRPSRCILGNWAI